MVVAAGMNISVAALVVMCISPDNCKMLLVSALFIAQKFWDDQALRNQDIPIAWQRATKDKRINLKQVNGLELEMLKAMGWELVRSPDWSFFHLRKTMFVIVCIELRSLKN